LNEECRGGIASPGKPADTTAANLQGSIKMHELPMPVSENLAPSNLPADSASNGITFAMTVVAIVLMAVYFAISVVAIPN
jgi:hypothetical protein